jgi:hypothetical protein
VWIFQRQEVAAAFETSHRHFGDNYSWQSGRAASPSMPQLFSQS